MSHPTALTSAQNTHTLRRHVLQAATATLLALAVPASFGLPKADMEGKGGDPAPRLLTPKPATAPATSPASALPDTAALMPGGKYILRITLRGDTKTYPVSIGRSGGLVNAALGGSDTLNGTLDPAGKLQLVGGNGTDRLELSAIVQNRRASGQTQLGRGAQKLVGSFTLDPAPTGVSKKMKEYVAPGPAPKCGFWCEMDKAWSCVKNWGNC